MRRTIRSNTLWISGSLLCLWLSACAINPPVTATTTLLAPKTQTPTQSIPNEIVPTPTPTPANETAWADQLTLVTTLEEALGITWSPTRNEFVAHDCRMDQEFGNLLYAEAPDFDIVAISPEGSKCNSDILSSTVIIWSLNGDEIYWWGLGAGPDLLPNALLMTDRDFSPPVNVGKQERSVSFHGWLDEDSLLLSNFTGGTARIGSIINVKTQETIAIISDFQEFYKTSPPAFVGEGPGYFKTEEPIQDTLVQMNDQLTFTSDRIPFHESFADPYGVRFIDWVPDQNQLLTLVWRDAYLLHEENITTELQLWDFNSNEVVPYIPNGYYGRYSPDGRYLAFYAFNKLTGNADGSFVITDEARSSYLYILDIATNELLFEFDAPSPPVFGDLDVRSPGEENQALLWSPDSNMLIFGTEYGRYSILELDNHLIQPIVLNPDIRLTEPDWSFDGSYLSITIFENDQPGKDAIFRVN